MVEETTPPQAAEATRVRESRRRRPRGVVRVFPKWCKGCGLCVEFCPGHVLEQAADGHVSVAHPEECRGCKWCELHCPDFAIFVTPIEDTGDEEKEDDKEAP